jgi:hypothetical protein
MACALFYSRLPSFAVSDILPVYSVRDVPGLYPARLPPPIALLLKTKAQSRFDRPVKRLSKPLFLCFPRSNPANCQLLATLLLKIKALRRISALGRILDLPFVRLTVNQNRVVGFESAIFVNNREGQSTPGVPGCRQGANFGQAGNEMDKVDNRYSTILDGTHIVLFTLEYFNPSL